MGKVTINGPKTPVTRGSNGVAAATTPNVCKMPGPPAPFVPTPLPNVGRSGLSPEGYSKTVKINGQPVALEGATFGSQGDVASKGTGGGIVSSAAHGITKFIGPGSMNVKIEGKRVHLLGDPMLNNCGPGGSPPNAATMMGIVQEPGYGTASQADPRPGHEEGGEPYCPPTDEEFKDRRNQLARDRSPGGRHEHAAAKHNEPEILRAEGEMKRAHGESRSCLSTGNDHKVTHSCKHCGAPMGAEIDHVGQDRSGTMHAVEAKSGADFYPAKSEDETGRNRRQMKRNVMLARNADMGVIYKIPGGHDKAEQQIRKLAGGLGMPPGKLQVIQI